MASDPKKTMLKIRTLTRKQMMVYMSPPKKPLSGKAHFPDSGISRSALLYVRQERTTFHNYICTRKQTREILHFVQNDNG